MEDASIHARPHQTDQLCRSLSVAHGGELLRSITDHDLHRARLQEWQHLSIRAQPVGFDATFLQEDQRGVLILRQRIVRSLHIPMREPRVASLVVDRPDSLRELVASVSRGEVYVLRLHAETERNVHVHFDLCAGRDEARRGRATCSGADIGNNVRTPCPLVRQLSHLSSDRQPLRVCHFGARCANFVVSHFCVPFVVSLTYYRNLIILCPSPVKRATKGGGGGSQHLLRLPPSCQGRMTKSWQACTRFRTPV